MYSTSDDAGMVYLKASDTAVLMMTPHGSLRYDDKLDDKLPHADTAKLATMAFFGDSTDELYCTLDAGCACDDCLIIDAMLWRVVEMAYAPRHYTMSERIMLAVYFLAPRMMTLASV